MTSLVRCPGSYAWPEGTEQLIGSRAICGTCGKNVHATRSAGAGRPGVLRVHFRQDEAIAAVAAAFDVPAELIAPSAFEVHLAEAVGSALQPPGEM